MTHPTSPTTIRTMTDLVEVIPTLLGFHPCDSIVVVAVEDGHVLVTARADLPREEERLAPALDSLWRRYPRALFLLLGFCADPAVAWATLARVDADLPATTERRYLVVGDDRWFDAPDGEGTPYDRLGNVHVARAAFEGRPVRRSRAELAALIETSRTPEEVAASLRRVEASLQDDGDLLGRAEALLAAHLADPGELDLDDVTLLCLASHDDGFLDRHLWGMTPQEARVQQRLWLQVVRASVPSCRGGALVALGLTSWLCGEGALQVVCLEALGRVAGPPGWIDLLDLVNTAALSPNHWDALVAGHRDVPATASGF
ncbi:DUF4192 family protein [Propioniciclava coleopterorum]|uniref:DUF4192 family protein n=1 Tax=Propioniciclava coleopterorum TaxID=2714937 RepID=A0A6G7Y2R9_9ACTN|nr:DUF4192 domain-containing protein [Propioniciclava coleopterorum]QIK71102.1 DUF4192 family protein [Propioniciclava coleopterorum]